MMASYVVMLTLAVNKTAMKKLTKKYMELGKEIEEEMRQDELKKKAKNEKE